MSGPATLGGAQAQANVIAYVGAHMLAREPLGWVFLGIPDIPTSVSGETGGPGDDLGITLEGTSTLLEAQVKQGLKRDSRLLDTFRNFVERLPAHPGTLAILITDQTSSESIRRHLRQDLERLAEGREDNLHEITREVLTIFDKSQRRDLLPRVRIQILDLQHPSTGDRKEAIRKLTAVTSSQSYAENAWSALVTDALEVCRTRGRRRTADLERLLSSTTYLFM